MQLRPDVVKTAFQREVRLLRTLAHPGRLAILASLRRRPACVCHLTVALGRSQAYISQQLAVLRDAGLIESRREGAFVYYHLREYGILGMVDLASRLIGSPAPPVPTTSERLPGCECPRCGGAAAATSGATR